MTLQPWICLMDRSHSSWCKRWMVIPLSWVCVCECCCYFKMKNETCRETLRWNSHLLSLLFFSAHKLRMGELCSAIGDDVKAAVCENVKDELDVEMWGSLSREKHQKHQWKEQNQQFFFHVIILSRSERVIDWCFSWYGIGPAEERAKKSKFSPPHSLFGRNVSRPSPFYLHINEREKGNFEVEEKTPSTQGT